jgi:hypothetical protein
MENKPEDFEVYHHAIPVKESSYSFTSVGVLPELIGKPWNEITMCYILALEPNAIRVSTGAITLDCHIGRITVMVNDENKIQKIYKEVEIPVPDDMFACDLTNALDKL